MEEVVKKKRKHLSLAVSITIGSTFFVLLLTTILSIVSYNVSKNVLYSRYQAQMTSIVDLAESFVDHDDMAACARAGAGSETTRYYETQAAFDKFAENYSDLHYLYILVPVDDARGAIAICSANTQEEYAEGIEVKLGDGEEGWYEDDVINQLKAIYAGDKDVFFVEKSVWGNDYTLARPVSDSSGVKYGLLCVDVSVDTIDQTLRRVVWFDVGLILGIGALFIIIVILWLYFFMVRPIRVLQKSVSEYASKTHNVHDAEALVFVRPNVIASREISELSDSVEKMSNDMRNYLLNIHEKEEEVQILHSSMEEMDVVAHKDALTGVNNKMAYDRDVAVINNKIAKGEPIAFAIVMVDINNLKGINDTYGHDSGDIYIKGACNIVKEVYKNSLIYRIGGDEIVVILQGEDYDRRDSLLKSVRRKFQISNSNDAVEEYMRYSAATGMGVFDKANDEEAYPVFRRADKAMYANKAAIKELFK